MSTVVGRHGFEGAFEPGHATATWKWEGPFHALAAAAACGAIAISVYGYFFFRLTLSVPQAMPTLVILFLLLAAAAQYGWRREQKCFNVVMMVFWIIMITNCHFFPMYMAARHDVPMNDGMLAAADAALCLEVPAVREVLAPYPVFNELMLAVYQSLIPLMALAAIVPPLWDRMEKAKEFVVACIVAAALSLPIFACFQAVGPWHYYGFDPVVPSLAGKQAMLATLKTDSLFVIDLANRDGLITFPSFHVVLTVLAAAALWPFRYLGPMAAIWAALIVVSTVTTGIHYSIDVVGGLLVAAIAYGGARAYLRWESGRRGSSAAPPNTRRD